MDTGKTSILLSQPPHQTTPEHTRAFVCDLLLAMAPAALLGVVNYGLRALLSMAICIVCGVGMAVLTDLLARRIVRLTNCLYTAYICLLCVFGFGAGCALWIPAFAGIACALLLSVLDPASGRGVFHPAVAVFLLCMLLFPAQTGAYIEPLDGFNGFFSLSMRNITVCAAPSMLLAQGETLSSAALALGGTAGAIGASSALALVVGGVYLILRHIAFLRAPATACAAMFVLALLFPAGQPRFAYAAAQLLCGGFLTGAVFFLLPAAGAPVSRRGQVWYALGYAALCFVIRRLSGADGAASALVLMQAFAWTFDFSRVSVRFSAARLGAYMESILLRGSRGRREVVHEPDAPHGMLVSAAPAAEENEPEPPQWETDAAAVEVLQETETGQAEPDLQPEPEESIPETDGEDNGNERI